MRAHIDVKKQSPIFLLNVGIQMRVDVVCIIIFSWCIFVTWLAYTMTDLLPFTPIEFIKIYIGQLPLDLEEHQLKQILEPLAELKEVKIIKGDNSRGRFDLFCYAFVTMKGNEAFAYDIIRTLQERYPTWKMNVKYQHDRQKMQRNPKPFNQPMPYPQQMGYQPYPTPMPRNFYHGYNSAPMQHPPNHMQVPVNASERIVGDKPCRILVRELWLGGIPENFERQQMIHIMSYYGIVEEVEIFPKFAFVKFKQASEATTAFEKADEIAMRMGNPQGFRVFFSDPARRAYIVSNHYEYDRQSPSLPILFLGFPPITSSTVEMEVIKPVVEKYGRIVGEYLRKNSNGQNRSYFLFSFDNVKNAIRAKQELNKRKDMLGDKRVEVTLLLDEQVILKGRDLTHTERRFQDPNSITDRRKGGMNYYGMEKGMMPPPMQMNYPPMYGNPYGGYNMPPPYYQQPPPYYYDQNYYKAPEEGEMHQYQPEQQQSTDEMNNHIHEFLKDVLAEKPPGNEKKPIKSVQTGKEEDILSKLLGSEAKLPESRIDKQPEGRERDDREPAWSGFLTWKSTKRVAVDGFTENIDMEDYAINIISLVQFKDVYLKDKHTMVLEPSNSISSGIFKEYIKQLRTRVGVGMNSKHLMYVMPKSNESDQIQSIREDELLVVLEKASCLTQIKDKLIKIEEPVS